MHLRDDRVPEGVWRSSTTQLGTPLRLTKLSPRREHDWLAILIEHRPKYASLHEARIEGVAQVVAVALQKLGNVRVSPCRPSLLGPVADHLALHVLQPWGEGGRDRHDRAPLRGLVVLRIEEVDQAVGDLVIVKIEDRLAATHVLSAIIE